jgi:hypothetical protein
MTTTNTTPPVQLIPVHRRPNLAKKIPIVVGVPHEANSPEMIEKWKGTTPQGREIIRKKLYALKRQIEAQQFRENWPRIASIMTEGLFHAVLAYQDEKVRERVCDHLTRTQQWPAFRDSVKRCSWAVQRSSREPVVVENKDAVEFLRQIAEGPESQSSTRLRRK